LERKQIKLNYWKGNFAEISKELDETNCEIEFQGVDVEEILNRFQNILLELVRKYVPTKKPAKKKKSPCISNETIKRIQKRGEAWSEYKEQPSEEKYVEYKCIRNQVTSLIRRDQHMAIEV
jgi:DNA repair ATPase RecN